MSTVWARFVTSAWIAQEVGVGGARKQRSKFSASFASALSSTHFILPGLLVREIFLSCCHRLCIRPFLGRL